MKNIYKVIFTVTGLSILTACSVKTEMDSAVPENEFLAQTVVNGRTCETMKVLERQLKENPGLANRMAAIEAHSLKVINGKGKPGGGGGGTGGDGTPYSGTIEIPVVVNVLYSNAAENISDTQIQSQIDVLNADFAAQNSDINSVPSFFQNAVGTMSVHFTLANIIRKSSNKSSWGTRDAMKKSKQGGIDPSDPSKYLNMWSCVIGGGILGYAQFPGGSTATDGVVIDPNYFGLSGAANAPYNLGRTATHEVGHWLNLRHIWGDGGCGVDDFVTDTPLSDSPNYGCPTFPLVKCSGTNMTMNYMDYTDDPCMYMFTNGQVDRSRALFASGGVRESIVLP